MKIDRDKVQKEVDDNYEFFKKRLPQLIKEHDGQFVLIRHKEIVGYFNSNIDALLKGKNKYSDEIYSIQEITTIKPSLGILDYAFF